MTALPGSGLGADGEGFFRVSFITSPEWMAEAARLAAKVSRSFGTRVKLAEDVVGLSGCVVVSPGWRLIGLRWQRAGRSSLPGGSKRSTTVLRVDP